MQHPLQQEIERLQANIAQVLKMEDAYRQQEQQTRRRLALVLGAESSWESVIERAEQAEAQLSAVRTEKHAFDNGSGMTETMTVAEMKVGVTYTCRNCGAITKSSPPPEIK